MFLLYNNDDVSFLLLEKTQGRRGNSLPNIIIYRYVKPLAWYLPRRIEVHYLFILLSWSGCVMIR